ncbi:MAG: hypothetical protein ACK4M9_17945 [Anaerobacillus sp.]|uniref:hypothetical protein n=1 Tax=Anaerobacillus sp. TaxID=1872506 RepID=UPI00391DCF28
MNNGLKVAYRSFFDMYTNLGAVLFFSIISIIGSLPIITIGPMVAALFYVMKLKLAGKNIGFKDFKFGLIKYGKKSSLIFVIYLFVMVPGVFYMITVSAMNSTTGQIVAIAIFSILLLWNLLNFYLYPLLVEQLDSDIGTLYLRSYRLIVENAIFTLVIIFNLLVFTVISILLPILLFVWAGWSVITIYNGLCYLLSKYDAKNYQFDLDVSWRGAWNCWSEVK